MMNPPAHDPVERLIQVARLVIETVAESDVLIEPHTEDEAVKVIAAEDALGNLNDALTGLETYRAMGAEVASRRPLVLPGRLEGGMATRTAPQFTVTVDSSLDQALEVSLSPPCTYALTASPRGIVEASCTMDVDAVWNYAEMPMFMRRER